MAAGIVVLKKGGLVLAEGVLEYARQNPETISTTIDKLRKLFQLKKPRVLVTGAKGVGKTVLCDYLSGQARHEGYNPPDISLRTEKYQMKSQGANRAFQLMAIPGEHSIQREEALEKLLEHEKDLSGVIHVVCRGFSRPRADLGELVLGQQLPTLEDLRRAGEQEELTDLQETLAKLRAYWKRRRKPFWLVVVASKYDLYANEGPQFVTQLHPDEGDGPFAQTLRAFRDQVGSDNVDIRLEIAAAWLDKLQWQGQVRRSQLDEDHDVAVEKRDIYISMLRDRLYRLAEG